MAHFALLCLLSLLCAGAAFGATPPPNGTRIVNIARVSFREAAGISEGSASVQVRVPTPAFIEFLQYAPSLPQAENIPVAGGAYLPGADPALPLQPLAQPRMTGAPTAIDLSNPAPLSSATQYHQNDPVFIRVTDLDMNADDSVREAIMVTVTVPETGDIEVIRLTETGPATGVFAGYISTSQGTGVKYDGTLQVIQGSSISATFTDPYDGSDTTAAAILVDPFGLLFDSKTGAPIDGVPVTLCDASLEPLSVSPLTQCTTEARVMGDDGFSSYPSTIVSGGSGRDDSGKLYVFPAGGYRFPYVEPGTYRYFIKAPAGYTAPSTVATPALQRLPGAPFVTVTGSRGEKFPLSQGPAIRIDVPLDPVEKGLWVTKSAGKDLVAPGEFITFDLSVANISKFLPAHNVQLVDAMPPGFRIRRGSATSAGAAVADPYVSTDGKTIIFSVGTLAPEAHYAVQFVAEVTAGTPIGSTTNLAFASGSDTPASNIARAAIKVRDDLLRTRSTLMGRVTSGACPENGEEPLHGLEGVRVYLEDGSFVASDKEGLFHFEGVKPGLHVVQMDLDSLPDGYAALPCTENSRFAGRAFSQFVEVQGGTLWRVDFHAQNTKTVKETGKSAPAEQREAALPPPLPSTPARMAIELGNSIDGTAIVYSAAMKGGKVPLSEVRLSVELPEGATYLPGTSAVAGQPVADPDVQGQKLLFTLGAVSAGWEQRLTFRASADKAEARELPASAYLAFTTPKGTRGLTPPAETSVRKVITTDTIPMPDVVVRPHFPTFGAELSEFDRAQLDELARILKSLKTRSITVTGHTDHVPIARRSRHIYKNNTALSLDRAKSVGRYLMEALHITPEQLTLDGKGEFKPIASNRTSPGRRLNRRVEVTIVADRIAETTSIKMLKEFSGSQQAEADADEAVAVSEHGVAEGRTSAAAGSPTETSSPSSAAAPSLAGTAPASSPAPAKVPPLSAGTAKGVLSPRDGETLLEKINSVQVRLDASLLPKLLVDGVEIASDRIGYRATEPENGTIFYSFIGVDFGDPGTHSVEIKGVDPFGNARFSNKARVIRTGEIARIRIADVAGNVADGAAPVRIRVELFDAGGTLLKGSARLHVKDGTLKPFVNEKEKMTLDDLTAGAVAEVDTEGWIRFQPVTSSGTFTVVLGYNSASAEADVYVKPKLRDWILVGLAEGTAGYNTASGNMESLKAGEAKEDFYQDGRIAFFAKGQIKGEWLLTMSYDNTKSSRDTGASLFQHIDPDSYYTLYGDSSQQQYDAASSKKLYLKIERDQFYAMFGDYDTGLSMTELSRYSRRMTGGKSEYQGTYLEANGFAAESTQVYQRDEIPGDGTSGLYRLKRRPLVINSDKITIVTRDRFRSELVLSSRTMSRFVDYAIDYDAGTIFFKQPIMSKDENFNPITIVAEYEALSDAGRDYTYGGRVGVKLLDKRLKIGASHIHEGLGEQKNDLFGVDTTILITDATKLRGEAAGTESNNAGVKTRGYSYLAELTHSSKTFDGKAYIREQQGDFGLGQQMGSESATRKFGLEGIYRLNETISSSASLYRQSNLAVDTERDVAEGKVTYATKKYSTSLGLLHARDRLADGSAMDSGQITAGGKLLTLNDRLTLSIDR
ncbi:MAG: OmpA family protein, partial [Pelobacteraceae bacterium]